MWHLLEMESMMHRRLLRQMLACQWQEDQDIAREAAEIVLFAG